MELKQNNLHADLSAVNEEISALVNTRLSYLKKRSAFEEDAHETRCQVKTCDLELKTVDRLLKEKVTLREEIQQQLN